MSLKSWLINQAIQGNLPNWMYRFAGKTAVKKLNLYEGAVMETKKWFQSKSVWTAIIGVLLGAVQPISSAFGHPITIPAWVFELLGGMGLYTLRTGDKTIA